MALSDLKAATKVPPKEVTIRIRRYSPTTGKTWWQEYKIKPHRGMTVLDALLEIKAKIDHTIVMRYSCRMGVCGSCGMIINGMPRLACQTQIAEVATENNPVITLEPLYNFPVLRDLLTDFTNFFEKHRSVKPYLLRNDEAEREEPYDQYIMSPEEYLDIYEYSLCISCGLCYAACPVAAADPEYLGPQALAYAARYVLDVRDEKPEIRLKIVDTEHGCHRCHYAGSCSMVCPKIVDPAQAIQRLRHILYKWKLGMWRKKTARTASAPKVWKPRKPLPPEVKPVRPDIDYEAIEKEPVTIEVDGIKITLRHLIPTKADKMFGEERKRAEAQSS